MAGLVRKLTAAGAVLGALLLCSPAVSAEDIGKVVVFAASSLASALDAVGAQWHAKTGKTIVVSAAASPALARQIEQGAPADVFISADTGWMDYLAERHLVRPQTRVNLLGNRLVLIAPKDKAQSIEIGPGLDLAGLLGDGRLAIGDVRAVPAGKYAKAALESLGLWPRVEGRLAMAENVRAALQLVSRGEAPLGIVYQTDARADAGVAVLGTFPEASHPAIVYPGAVTATSQSPDAKAFLEYLRSDDARTVFEAQGFIVLR